jgi:hypothetical protein
LAPNRRRELVEGCAALGAQSAMQAYLDTERTGAMDGEKLKGAWIVWVDHGGMQQVLRWGANPYSDKQTDAVPE